MQMGPEIPNSYYRVSVRAIITNESNEILMVNEKGLGWSTPGGGLDWGEDPVAGLHRELMEELGCDGEISPLPVMVTSFSNEKMNQHLLWLMYRVKLDANNIQATEHVSDHCFMTHDEHVRSETESDSDWVCATNYKEDLKKALNNNELE